MRRAFHRLARDTVDFLQLFIALREAGYDGWLVVEDFSAERPSREALHHNLTFIRETLSPDID